MTEQQEHKWHIEFEYMRAQLSYVVDNIDSISKRYEVELKLEDLLFRIHQLCEQTKGEAE